MRYSKHLSEGRHRADELTTFDYTKRLAIWTSFTKNRHKEIPLQPDTRDLNAFTYFVRQTALQTGDKKQFQVLSDNKIYDLMVQVGPLETVRTPEYGPVPSLRLDPEAAFQGLFVSKGKVTLWVTPDDPRLVTKIEGTVPVASIRVLLVDVRGPGAAEWQRRVKTANGGAGDEPAAATD